MNLIFVSQVHPSTSHVSGVRAWSFATEMAKSGHRVLQLSECLSDTEEIPAPRAVPRIIERHNWREPLLIPILARSNRVGKKLRSSQTHPAVRKAAVAWTYLRHSGVQVGFSHGAEAYISVLSEVFEPNLSWGVFGNAICWHIAQRISKESGCPWIGDMKDPWHMFVPRTLRTTIAKRFRGMAACTANSQFNRETTLKWFNQDSTVVYSGVHSSFLQCTFDSQNSEGDRRTIVMAGGLYQQRNLEAWASGIVGWLHSISPSERSRYRICYAGGDFVRFDKAIREARRLIDVTIHQYLPIDELSAICSKAWVNSYIRSKHTFHHKLLELLSCGRPIIAYPGESDEAASLAVATGGDLHCCSSPGEIMRTMQVLHRSSSSCTTPRHIDSFSWPKQAARLEKVFANTVNKSS